MKLVTTPEYDTANSDNTPDVELEVLGDGRLRIELHHPSRAFTLSYADTRAISMFLAAQVGT